MFEKIKVFFSKVKEFFVKIGMFFKGTKEKYNVLSENKKKFIRVSFIFFLGLALGSIGTYSIFNRHNKDIERRLSEVAGKYDKLLETYRDAREQITRIESLYRKLEARNKEIEGTVNILGSDNQQLIDTNRRLGEVKEQLRREITKLQEQDRINKEIIESVWSGLDSVSTDSEDLGNGFNRIRELIETNIGTLSKYSEQSSN